MTAPTKTRASATELEPGMVITHKGWWTSSRKRIRYLVVAVKLPDTSGGWMGKRYFGILHPVRVRYERLDTGRKGHFVVEHNDVFDVVHHERADVAT